jgi:hypothetical protein
LAAAALAISSLLPLGLAATTSTAVAAGRSTAPGQLKRAATPDVAVVNGVAVTTTDAAPVTDAPAAASGPGGQVCDGDPSGNSSTGSGANSGNGDYTNTCPAGPSLNGNNDGTTTGKPCAGCVGNADDKNPPGQYANGNDANNGYECDQQGRSANEGNNGVGFGNPAHTGCAQDTTPPPPGCNPATDANHSKPSPGGRDMPAGGSCDETHTPTCPDGLAVAPGGTCDRTSTVPHDVLASVVDRPAEVLGEVIVRDAAAPASPAAVAGTTLPRTGTDAVVLVRTALLLLVGGGGLVTAGRLRRREAYIDIAGRLAAW